MDDAWGGLRPLVRIKDNMIQHCGCKNITLLCKKNKNTLSST